MTKVASDARTPAATRVVAQDRDDRDLHALATVHRFAKDRRLLERHADIETDQDQQAARHERDAPTEREELLVGEQTREQQERSTGEHEAQRRSELREHAVPGALARRRVLDRQ